MQTQFTTIVESFHRQGRWTSADCAEVFGRLITESAFDGELTEHLAVRWGTSAGHYANLALMQRENIQIARADWTEAVGERRQFETVMEARGFTVSRPDLPEVER